MNTCSQVLTGLARDCAPSMGGVKEVYIANHSDVGNVTIESDKVNSITMNMEAKFSRYSFKPEIASMTSTLNVDGKTGANYVTTDLVLGFNRMETTKRIEIGALAQNDLAVIVLDQNGVFWYLGYEEPVYASAGTGETGTARGDKNGYTITLQDCSKTFPYEVEGSIVAALIKE